MGKSSGNKVARNKEEYKKIKKEIDEDPRKISDLFVDRYGAQPLSSTFLIPEDKFSIHVIESARPVAVELFNKESIECLLHSIPVKELFKTDIKYIKIETRKDSPLAKNYEVKKSHAY